MRDAITGVLGACLLAVLVLAASTSCRGDLFESDWEEASADPHPLLVEDALLVRSVRRMIHPSPERYFVRFDGDDASLDELDDLRPFVVPIEGSRQAGEYVDLVRFLRLDGAPPGIGASTPNRGGVRPDFAERVQGTWDLRREVATSGGGFEIDEPVVAGWDDLRLIELHVRVERDGTLTWAERGTVADGPEVDALLFRAR